MELVKTSRESWPHEIIGAPAWGPIPEGSTWAFWPATTPDGEAAAVFHDFSEEMACEMTNEEYEAKKAEYARISLSWDYSQGVPAPTDGERGMAEQVRHLFDLKAPTDRP